MNFSLLRILVLSFAFLLLIESVLEVRAYYRGFDTIFFGNFQRQNSSAAETLPSLPKPEATLTSNTAAKRSEEIRYWIASSSHAEDIYLSRDLIFPFRLEKLLQKPGLLVKVINASHAGMDIEANRADLESRGTAIKPDVVILYQMSTQITKLSKQLLSGKHPGSSKAKSEGQDSSKPTSPPSWISQLYENTSLYALLKGNISNRLTGQRVLADSLGKPADLEFERQVNEFVNTVRQVGAQPVLCTFTTSHTRRQMPNVPNEVTDLLFRYNVYLSLSGWFDTITRFNQILKRVADEQQIRLIDLDSVLSGHSEYFRDFVHFTPEGHEKVAETIYAGLQIGSSQTLASETANAK